MLLNNLDRGGRRASRGARRLRRHRPGRALARGAEGDRPRAARCSSDDETLLVQSGKPVAVFRTTPTVAARADRELAARSEVGDVGRVPAARGRGADDVRADDRRLVDLHRHAGDPAGHLPDVRRRRPEALRLVVARRADDPHRRARRHGRRAAARRDARRRGDPLRRGRPVADRAPARDALPRRGDRVARRRARAHPRRRAARDVRSRSGCSATRPTSCPSSRGAASTSISSPTRPPRTIRSPATSRHGLTLEEAAALRSSDPDEYLRRAGESIAAPRRGAARVRPGRQLRFRLWQQPAR